MHVGVIGAGALGLMAAWKLAEAGHQVTVIEREPTVGGLAVSFAIGGGQIERYYHHIFRSDTRIIRLIDELGLGDRMIWDRPTTAVRVDDRSYPLDSPINVLRFPKLSFPDRLRLGMAVAYLKAVPSPERFEAVTASEWLRRWMGPAAYRTIWEPQLRGKLGAFANDVAMPWFWARIHDRSMALGYLRGGFGQLYDRLADRIRARGGTIRLNEGVRHIGQDEQGPAIETDLCTDRFNTVIVTLPTAVFLRVAPNLPSVYRDRYANSSPHLGAHNVVLGLDRATPLQDAYWLSICQEGYPFLAFIEHTNYLPREDYGGLRVYYLGNYLPQDHRLFGLSDEETIAEMVPGMRRLNPDFDPATIRESAVNRAPFAQPIVTRGYRDRQPGFATPWPNVWLANMGMVYPHDRGQNYSLILGEQLANRILATWLEDSATAARPMRAESAV